MLLRIVVKLSVVQMTIYGDLDGGRVGEVELQWQRSQTSHRKSVKYLSDGTHVTAVDRRLQRLTR